MLIEVYQCSCVHYSENSNCYHFWIAFLSFTTHNFICRCLARLTSNLDHIGPLQVELCTQSRHFAEALIHKLAMMWILCESYEYRSACCQLWNVLTYRYNLHESWCMYLLKLSCWNGCQVAFSWQLCFRLFSWKMPLPALTVRELWHLPAKSCISKKTRIWFICGKRRRGRETMVPEQIKP